MKAFFDTSVLVASARQADLRCEVSQRLLAQFGPDEASCAGHTLAELYANLTGMRPPNRLRPEQAMIVLKQLKSRLACVVLTPEELFETIQRTASLSLAGGIVYDALLLGCARKVNAERIYTWNLKHFQLVAPDLADRIVTP